MDSVEHVLSFSYGKDSTACFGACEILGWKIDRVVTADLWATQTVPADHPLMVEYKAKADEIIKQRWGLTVEHCCAKYVDTVCGNPVSYEDVFYHLRKKGKFPGTIVGFPMRHGWCIKLKTDAIKRMVTTDDAVQYLGIAADEPERLARLDGISKVSPLAAVGWTEADCWKWCEENDLLSPIYTTSTRGGGVGFATIKAQSNYASCATITRIYGRCCLNGTMIARYRFTLTATPSMTLIYAFGWRMKGC